MPFFIEEMSEDYVRKAASEANLLNSIIFGEDIQVLKKEDKPKEDQKEPEEEESEEEDVGIGGLFG
jgi:hypothetical protein